MNFSLSRATLDTISTPGLKKPDERIFDLPEKILQFGTGVLLRGLCDYHVDKANREGRFNGRIVVVKSTAIGDTHAFENQDNLYTICVRGMNDGKIVSENIICSAISRVIAASSEWNKVLELAKSTELRVVISNTTEVGLQLVKESIHQLPPASFPARLLSFIYARYRFFEGKQGGELVVIPTELITGNGEKLKKIIEELAAFNGLEEEFLTWMGNSISFCNSLVDRIVTKDPGEKVMHDLQAGLGYNDELLTMCEDYHLWAIEGGDHIKRILSFAGENEGAFVSNDIGVFRTLKLHLLNGTHTLSASLAFLAGFDTVKQAMNNEVFRNFVENLMLGEIASAMPVDIAEQDKISFGRKVVDRFRNPFLEHQWLNITLQNTTKMRMRNVPVLQQFQQQNGPPPERMATGFAAYILFMKGVKKESGIIYGSRDGSLYRISDDHAEFFFELWQREDDIQDIVNKVLQNISFWGCDLSTFTSFQEMVVEKLSSMLKNGVAATLNIKTL